MITFPKVALLAAQGYAPMLLLAVAGFFALLWIDRIPLDDARPPQRMNSIEEFRLWKGDKIRGIRLYTDRNTGKKFKVLLAPSGRILASGPSAYLFDDEGKFVDWTPDMGDIFTSVHHYDLSNGNLVRSD